MKLTKYWLIGIAYIIIIFLIVFGSGPSGQPNITRILKGVIAVIEFGLLFTLIYFYLTRVRPKSKLPIRIAYIALCIVVPVAFLMGAIALIGGLTK